MGRVLAALLGVGLLIAVQRATAQEPGPPVLREAAPGEIWIPVPDVVGHAPARPSASRAQDGGVLDLTPPTDPGNLQAFTSGLFRIAASWSPSTDPESGIDYYAFAIGTGTTSDTEANVRWWQSTGTETKASVNMALTAGTTYYISVRANNGANLGSAVVHSAPLTALALTYGGAGNQIAYTFAAEGISSTGSPTSGWPAGRAAEFTSFLDKMVPVLTDLYGPPSTSYTVLLVRDLRYTASAIFMPSVEEVHMGDNVTYQLLTHEMVHAFRRDRLLASGPLWEYDNALSGFEEGFAQAVSYEAMTEFARRYPSFGLTQKVYQSSNEWDYDFQNVPALGTTDFWSDTGGMNLHWARYEMAAAAIAKISREHPGFAKAFNAEFYRRITETPTLTVSRALVVDIVAAVAPSIEGVPAATWIDRQYVLDCVNHYGRKVWIRTQHYPWTEYLIFQYTQFYETFSNGSDWAVPDGQGGYIYHSLNGSTGTGTLRDWSGAIVWQRSLTISPTANPPAFQGFGSDEAHLTTQATNQPWPGGDPAKYVTNLLSFGLYRLTTSFTAGATATSEVYRVIGAPLRNTKGVFGGVLGGNGGSITLAHRGAGGEIEAPLVNGAFQTAAPWASLDHPDTSSNDSVPGIVDVTYVDAVGNRYMAVRTIGYGSWNGNQAFLFDVSKMTAVRPAMAVDSLGEGDTVNTTFAVSGWAVDQGSTSTTGVDAIHIWAVPRGSNSAQFVAVGNYGQSRPDIGSALGARFANSGYSATATLTPGDYLVLVYMHSSVTGTFNRVIGVNIHVTAPATDPYTRIDHPNFTDTRSASQPFDIDGWVIDRGAASGTGINTVHIWAFQNGQQPGTFVCQDYGRSRPDIASAFGDPRFTNSGYSCTIPPGMFQAGTSWFFVVFGNSSVTNAFSQSAGAWVTFTP